MKTKLLLLAVSVAAFTSCSTMYKTGQTPDDVYYSPARPFYDEAQTDTKKDDGRNEQTYVYNSDDRMIRMGIADSRWRYLNYNNDYSYSPYNYSYNRFNGLHGYYGSSNYYGNYGNYYNSSFNNVYFNDYYYNPFYNPYPVYVKPATLLKNSTPRVTNLNAYGNNYNNANAPLMSIPAPRPRNYNNSNRSSGLGNVLDKVLSPSSNNNNSNNATRSTTTTPERTYTPPPASSSSSSSGSSSSGSSGSSRISRPN